MVCLQASRLCVGDVWPNMRTSAQSHAYSGPRAAADTFGILIRRIMNNFQEKVGFIWSVADLLRGDFKQSEYGKMTGFFSVSLSAAGNEKQKADADRCLNEFLQQANWSPTIKTTCAGGLAYRKYGFLKRWMMKRIARDAGADTDTSKDHEYTDWQAVDTFVKDFLVHVEPHQARERT